MASSLLELWVARVIAMFCDLQVAGCSASLTVMMSSSCHKLGKSVLVSLLMCREVLNGLYLEC